MKSIKIIIAIAILSTSFYACKKEELNLESNEVNYVSQNQNNLTDVISLNSEAVLNSTGIVKIVFDKMGTFLIEGNPNIEKLLYMYNGSTSALNSANEIFELSNVDKLYIIFDKKGYALSSNIPAHPVGSSFDNFLSRFCKVNPTENINLTVSKYELNKTHKEFWNALPLETVQNLDISIKKLQENMPNGFSLKFEISTDQIVNVTLLDPNGNPQPIQNSEENCNSTAENSNFAINLMCKVWAAMSWF